MKTIVIYSPQPDEQQESSASFEYAKRIPNLIHDKDQNARTVDIQRLSLDSLAFMTPDTNEESESSLYIFIIACSADGSVDRIVRKIVRSLKSKVAQDQECNKNISMANHTRIGIVLLGHARCENSANQMKDTIFSNGRKFQNGLKKSLSLGDLNVDVDVDNCVKVIDGLEVQVELECPDSPGGFDDWVKKATSSF